MNAAHVAGGTREIFVVRVAKSRYKEVSGWLGLARLGRV